GDADRRSARAGEPLARRRRLLHRPAGGGGDGRLVRRFHGRPPPVAGGLLFPGDGRRALRAALLCRAPADGSRRSVAAIDVAGLGLDDRGALPDPLLPLRALAALHLALRLRPREVLALDGGGGALVDRLAPGRDPGRPAPRGSPGGPALPSRPRRPALDRRGGPADLRPLRPPHRQP